MRVRRDVLVVMAKSPAPGTVKTRLARAVGGDRACALYRAFLADLAARFARGPRQLVWAVDPPRADLGGVVGPRASRLDQRGYSLGERMWRCFDSLFAAGARRVVMIGADVPHLADAVIEGAFEALVDADVVLVPSRDGGYVLVGLRHPHDLFTSVRMSTPRVYADTMARIATLGLRTRALVPSFDVDELDDVRALDAVLAAGEVALPNTARVLAEWRAEGLLPARSALRRRPPFGEGLDRLCGEPSLLLPPLKKGD